MRPNKSIRFEPTSLMVLRHLQDCEVCLSRVTGAVGTIQAADRELLVRHVASCMRYALSTPETAPDLA